MTNTFRIMGLEVVIEAPVAGGPDRIVFCRIDARDLPIVAIHDVTWYAFRSRAKRENYYVHASLRSGHSKRTSLVGIHRLIMGKPNGDVDHIDNDGLNNTRANLQVLSHRQNARACQPHKDWAGHDQQKAATAHRKRLVAIGREIQERFSLTRQQMWKIRTGQTRHSPAARAYREAVRAAGLPLTMWFTKFDRQEAA